MIMDKKAQEGGSLSIITKAVLVLLILFVLIVIFLQFFGDQSKLIDKQICGLGHDQDGDGYPDTVDRCPCDEGKAWSCGTDAKKCTTDIYAECKKVRDNEAKAKV
jgi:hypothetical protein